MTQVAEILRSSADWYEPLVDPDDMGQHDVDASWAEENFARREFFVLRRRGEVVGTLSLQEAGDCLYLGYVYLHVDHVGNGHGRRLLRFAADEGRRRGMRALVLIAHPDATWAVRAYEKFGFRVVARTDEDVLAWNDGWLGPYHEAGFHLFEYDLT